MVGRKKSERTQELVRIVPIKVYKGVLKETSFFMVIGGFESLSHPFSGTRSTIMKIRKAHLGSARCAIQFMVDEN
jgi:hypothetical protein